MDYASSGVNIDAGTEAVERIKPLVKRTFSPHVLANLGHFAAMVEVPEGYKKPVLVSCTDGVGTKVKLGIESGRVKGLGVDLVAMSVNDMICCGAKPLFFLDYIACHELVPSQMEALVAGMSDGCLQSDCSLVGGEMAEMNDLYHKGDFDLAGFAVGVVEKADIIDGSRIKSGQFVYGIASSGIHSNGYSLVRKVMALPAWKKENISFEDIIKPTRIYVKKVLELLSQYPISGLSHITGGGLPENADRGLPKNVSLDILKSSWEVPAVFKALQNAGDIAEDEMYRVFNMGVGMVVISESEIVDPELFPIGRVVPGDGTVILR